MIIDRDDQLLSALNISPLIRILNISRNECFSSGYHHSTHMGNQIWGVVAWDKGLFYFTLLNQNYSFVWFVEDDAFIPSTQAFRAIHQLYSVTNDLIFSKNEISLSADTSQWYHRNETIGKFVPPFSHSMVNLVGLSRRMLAAVAEDIYWRGTSLFHEYYFPTLAFHSNMTTVTPMELETLLYRENYTWEQIVARPNNFWHPIKDLSQQQQWRLKLVFVLSDK